MSEPAGHLEEKACDGASPRSRARELHPAHIHLAMYGNTLLLEIQDLCLEKNFCGASTMISNSMKSVEGPLPHNTFLGMDTEIVHTIRTILPKLCEKTLKTLDPYEARFLVDLLAFTTPAPAIPFERSELLDNEEYQRRRLIVRRSLKYVDPKHFVFCLWLFSQDHHHADQKQIHRAMVHDVIGCSQWRGGPMRCRLSLGVLRLRARVFSWLRTSGRLMLLRRCQKGTMSM